MDPSFVSSDRMRPIQLYGETRATDSGLYTDLKRKRA
jgi:hypothetical protein